MRSFPYAVACHSVSDPVNQHDLEQLTSPASQMWKYSISNWHANHCWHRRLSLRLSLRPFLIHQSAVSNGQALCPSPVYHAHYSFPSPSKPFPPPSHFPVPSTSQRQIKHETRSLRAVAFLVTPRTYAHHRQIATRLSAPALPSPLLAPPHSFLQSNICAPV